MTIIKFKKSDYSAKHGLAISVDSQINKKHIILESPTGIRKVFEKRYNWGGDKHQMFKNNDNVWACLTTDKAEYIHERDLQASEVDRISSLNAEG